MDIGEIKRVHEVEAIDAPVPTVVPLPGPVETPTLEPDPTSPR